jgi:pSer/pThr/pTyr-binding forkhead associated (FHA) protein
MKLRLICNNDSLIDGPLFLASGENYKVGRSSRCNFVLDDLSVSRVHAEVSVNGETVCVADLKSRNGTFVDGVRVTKAELQPGQSVSFGNAQFHLISDKRGDEFPADVSEMSTHFVHSKAAHHPPAALRLSIAQLRVLDLLLTGRSEKEVAVRLQLSPHTVHNHVKVIYRRMKVSSRPELLALFVDEERKPDGKKADMN